MLHDISHKYSYCASLSYLIFNPVHRSDRFCASVYTGRTAGFLQASFLWSETAETIVTRTLSRFITSLASSANDSKRFEHIHLPDTD